MGENVTCLLEVIMLDLPMLSLNKKKYRVDKENTSSIHLE